MDPPTGYQPPHKRAQSRANTTTTNTNNNTANRGSQRGRGQRQRTWRGSSQSSSTNDAEMGGSSELEKRRQRFQEEAVTKKFENGYGFVSRGEDSRLQRDPEARHAFFEEITREFVQVYERGDGDSLTEGLGKLSLNEKKDTPSKQSSQSTDKDEPLSNVLMSLRKLREALLNSPPDEFAKSVFLFSIRTSARVGHYQTYVPSINYLLKHRDVLTKSEIHEVAYLHALHLSHFNQEHTKALEVLMEYCPGDVHLHQVLTTFRNLEYRTWLDLLHKEKDVPRYRLMQFGETSMCEHAVKCIEKSYFQLPEAYVKEMFGMDVAELVKKYQCSWKVANGTVVVRER